MTNEEKARELCMAIEPPYIDFIQQNYKTALQAMQWKEQQLIDKACEWLAKNDSYAIPTNVQVDRLREHLNNIK